MLSTSFPQTPAGVLQPTRLHVGPIGLVRLEHAAVVALSRPLHPSLQGVRRFVEALLTLPSASARRLGTAHPEVWAAVLETDDAAPILGLGWLAGEATEVIAAPGPAHDEVTRRLVDVMLVAARNRRLAALVARLSVPLDRDATLTGLDARIVGHRDGTLFLHLDLGNAPGD